jgi:hypothetical protein
MLEDRYEEALEFALRLQNGITNLQDALDAKLAPVVEAAPPKPRREHDEYTAWLQGLRDALLDDGNERERADLLKRLEGV